MTKKLEQEINNYWDINQSLYNQTKNKIIKEIFLFLNQKREIKKIWEPGAGPGFWTEFFINQKMDLTASDINKIALQENQKNNPNAKFILGNAAEINLNDSFDLIFVKDVIEHVEDDKKLIKNFKKHLKENGILFITTQNSFSLNYFLEKVYHYLKREKKWFGWDKDHVRFYNFFILKKLLEQSGFKIIKCFGFYHFPYRALTKLLTGKIREKRIFHLIETIKLNNRFPLNITGWNIGLIAENKDKK